MIEKKSKILVFIPAYRCETQIRRVLAQFDSSVQEWVDTVIVVDNRSPDGTLDAAIETGKSVINNCNFIVWKNSDNYGLGGSHKAAFTYAQSNGFDYLVVLHGDDQADVRDLIPQLQNGSFERVDCLLGARFMPGSRIKGYSWFRTFGNRVYNLLFSMVVARRIYDLGSGLNLYRLAAFKDFYFKRFPDDLTFNYVMLLASYQRRQNIRFFPISWREEDQISNVKLFSQAFKVLRLLGTYGLRRGAFLKTEMRAKAFEGYSGNIEFSQVRKGPSSGS